MFSLLCLVFYGRVVLGTGEETIVITGIPSGVVRRSCNLTVHPGTTTFTLIDCGENKGILYCKFDVCKSTKATSIKPTRLFFFYFYSVSDAAFIKITFLNRRHQLR